MVQCNIGMADPELPVAARVGQPFQQTGVDMKIRLILASTAAILAAPLAAQDATPAMAPAVATDPAVVKPGRTLRDASNVRLGKIDRVNADGSVKIIFDSRFVTVPAESIRVTDGEPSTTLTKRDVSRLR